MSSTSSERADRAKTDRVVFEQTHLNEGRKMRPQALTIALLSLIALSSAQAGQTKVPSASSARWAAFTADGVRMAVPAPESCTQGFVLGDRRRRADLAPRDGSIITLAALIAQNHTAEMPYHFNVALDNGVNPSEISEIITHLAFYSGWANAMSAGAIAKDVLAERGTGADKLSPALGELLPLIDEVPIDETADAYVLFRKLWLLPDLAPRDRSLATVSALVASGQVARIPYHLNRAMDDGLTQTEALETVRHLAAYADWSDSVAAVSVAKDVFEQRTNKESYRPHAASSG